MGISYWLDRENKSTEPFDVTIVGAGIAGVSTAYWLEKLNPHLKIALVDRGRLGFGASGRNAGFVTCGSIAHFEKLQKQFGRDQAVQIWKFSEENRRLLLQEIIQEKPEEVQFQMTGACTVAPDQEDFIRYQALAQEMNLQGIDVDIITEQDLHKNFGVRHFAGGLKYRHDGVVHPILLLKKIFSKLKRTTLFENEEVFSIQKNIVISDQRKFQSDKIILTLNGYLPLLNPFWKEHLKPQRGQIMVSEPLPQFVKGPCYLTKHLCYFRQLVGGELLIGGFRNADLEAENTFLDHATPKIQSALLDFSRHYFELGEKIKMKYEWAGIMGFTTDGQMLIGEDPQSPGVHLIAGCSGHGMGLNFHAAKVLAESLSGASIPSYFDIQRIDFTKA